MSAVPEPPHGQDAMSQQAINERKYRRLHGKALADIAGGQADRDIEEALREVGWK